MSKVIKKTEVEKRLTKIEQRIEKLEQQRLPTQQSDKQTAMEAAQDAHEEALESYNTKRVGGMRHSHCGQKVSEAEVEKWFKKTKSQ